MTTATTTLRPVADGDREFLVELYGSVRVELAQLGRAFAEQQLAAQEAHHRAHYPGATLDVIEVDGAPAGRLYVHRGETDIRVMDIALLPEHRGRGIGTDLMTALIAESEASSRKLSLHVEPGNPARALYERLGFVAVAATGAHVLMERAT